MHEEAKGMSVPNSVASSTSQQDAGAAVTVASDETSISAVDPLLGDGVPDQADLEIKMAFEESSTGMSLMSSRCRCQSTVTFEGGGGSGGTTPIQIYLNA